MSDTLERLQSKLGSEHELKSVVRTMKALAAANIGQYERAVRSLEDYYRTVELGLAAHFRDCEPFLSLNEREHGAKRDTGSVIFGSDQGLVGRFNEVLANYATNRFASRRGKNTVWAIGERMGIELEETGVQPLKVYPVPNSVAAITPMVTQLLEEIERFRARGGARRVLIFRNKPLAGAASEPAHQLLLPLDQRSVMRWSRTPWPTRMVPEVLVPGEATLLAMVREHLFVSLFRACAESLMSENACRLAAMQRAERNIGELLDDLARGFNQARQNSIDEELFDLLGGFEALSKPD